MVTDLLSRRKTREESSLENIIIKEGYLKDEKISKNYNNNINNIDHIINKNYLLEERIEELRGRSRGEDDNNLYTQLINLSDNNKKLVAKKRSMPYFAEAAREILGESQESDDLARVLAEFSEGPAREDFGVAFLSQYLRQGYAAESPRVSKSFFGALKDRASRLIGLDNPKAVKPDVKQSSVSEAPQVEVSQDELKKYGLRLDAQLEESHFGANFRSKYFDTAFNFCLTYGGNLIASVGFNPDEGRIFIEQIQGIKGSYDKLRPFKWERALVDYAVDWAKKHNVGGVGIVSVNNNKWSQRHGHLDREKGKMLYDVTAKRCGFKRDSTGNYSMALTSELLAA